MIQGMDERNAGIRKWIRGNVPLMASAALRMGIRNYTGAFYGTFKAKVYTHQGRVFGGGYKMPRHAIYVHKGVGRGYPISGRKEPGEMTKAFAGKKSRVAKPFFNSVLEQKLPELADMVAQMDAEIISKNIFIKS